MPKVYQEIRTKKGNEEFIKQPQPFNYNIELKKFLWVNYSLS